MCNCVWELLDNRTGVFESIQCGRIKPDRGEQELASTAASVLLFPTSLVPGFILTNYPQIAAVFQRAYISCVLANPRRQREVWSLLRNQKTVRTLLLLLLLLLVLLALVLLVLVLLLILVFVLLLLVLIILLVLVVLLVLLIIVLLTTHHPRRRPPRPHHRPTAPCRHPPVRPTAPCPRPPTVLLLKKSKFNQLS